MMNGSSIHCFYLQEIALSLNGWEAIKGHHFNALTTNVSHM